MTRPADDKDWTNLVAGYVLGNLNSEEAAILKQQLKDNPALAEEIAAFQETLSLLPYALPTTEPSARLKSNLLKTASKTASTPKPTAKLAAPTDIATKRTLQKRRRWRPSISTGISASIAAIAIAALGITQTQLHTQTQQAATLQQQLDDTTAEIASLRNQIQEAQTVTALLGDSTTQVRSLIKPALAVAADSNSRNDNTTPSAKLLAKVGEREIIFVAQDLPQLEAEQVYRLWAIADESSDSIYCGQFRQDASGTARWSAPDSACTANPSRLLITLDAPDDPITSAGPLILETDA